MIGIILVSHSQKLTDGLKELITQMSDNENVHIISAGGTGDGRLGTSAAKIMEAIESLENAKGILIFTDIGSSIMSSESAIDMLDEELQAKTQLVNAPLVEGSFAAAIKASTECSLDDILTEIELTKS